MSKLCQPLDHHHGVSLRTVQKKKVGMFDLTWKTHRLPERWCLPCRLCRNRTLSGSAKQTCENELMQKIVEMESNPRLNQQIVAKLLRLWLLNSKRLLWNFTILHDLPFYLPKTGHSAMLASLCWTMGLSWGKWQYVYWIMPAAVGFPSEHSTLKLNNIG